jgi:hypothetical protein
VNEENTKKLVEAFPTVFHTDFHFECDDGWYELIYECAEALQDLRGAPVEAKQVKEKLGTLRFYVDGSEGNYRGAHAITGFYEGQSAYRCEVCGSIDGRLASDGGWLKTVCKLHLDSHGGRRFKYFRQYR